MTQREAFDAWYSRAASVAHGDLWEAWQAATRHAAQLCTCPAKDMPFGRCCKVLARQQHVMQRAMDAWDATTHQKNGDGRLWQCMEELRGECTP